MESKMFVVLLSVAIVAVCRAVKEVNLGSSSTTCGTKIELKKEDELTVYSKGGAPRGACSLVLNAIDDTTTECPYRAFCIQINKMITSCAAKIVLIGTSYKGPGMNTREISCYSSLYGAWCSQSRTLQISVLEDPKSTSPYAFNLTVESECSDAPAPEYVETYLNARTSEDVDKEIYRNRIIGAAIAVSFCGLFLVIFGITCACRRRSNYKKQMDMH